MHYLHYGCMLMCINIWYKHSHVHSHAHNIYTYILTSDVREEVGDRTNRDYFDSCVTRRHFLTKTDIRNIQTKVA